MSRFMITLGKAMAKVTSIVLLAIPGAALAQSPFAGAYFGTTFGSGCENGEFAFIVRGNNTAVVVSFDRIDEEGFVNTNVAINSDGSFTNPNIDGQGTSAVGSFTGTGVSGTFEEVGACSGTFSGTKAPTTGPLSDPGGYYTGTISGTISGGAIGTFSGPLYVVVAADGQTFAFGDATSPQFGPNPDGGTLTTSASGTVSGTLLTGTSVSGSLNFSTLTGSGTSFFTDGSIVSQGNWSISRQEPLPVPPPPPTSFKLARGVIPVNHTWLLVSVSGISFVDPVVIAGPPTFHGSQPGVVRVRSVTGTSFELRFQEWDYLDVAHAVEQVDLLMLEAGRFSLSDGSIWEVGSFPLGGTGAWQAEAFDAPFPAPPAVFLSIQTTVGGQAATVRARSVTANGFEAALFEQEALMDGHVVEQVGYLAIHSPEGSGEIDVGGNSIPYLLQSPLVDQRFAPVLSSAIKVEEEQSRDVELGHVQETLSVLALEDLIFAQDVSSRGSDTAALRRLFPEFNAPLEWGTVDGVSHDWTTVPLAKSYANPVVVAKPVSAKGSQPGVIRLRKVGNDSFDLRYQEWAYLDGAHIPERVFYMVAEAGQFSVAGLDVEAGKLSSSLLLSGGFETVGFSTAFLDPPGVFTSVMTTNGGDPVITRVDGLTASGFFVTMDEEEAKADGHIVETLGWIAIEAGSGTTTDKRDVAVGQTTANHQPAVKPLGLSTDRQFPVLVGDVVSTFGRDPVSLRYRNLTANSAELNLQEEQSLDAETAHLAEDVSIFAAE